MRRRSAEQRSSSNIPVLGLQSCRFFYLVLLLSFPSTLTTLPIHERAFQEVSHSKRTMTESDVEVKHGKSPSSQSLDHDSSNGTSTPEQIPQTEKPTSRRSLWRRIYDILTYTPPRCRWDPQNPPQFSMAINVLFGFSGAFTVANLYYSHPILNILAEEFNVPYEKASQVPTVMQAGYAAGLLFLCPLGDLLRRRPFVLSLVFFTATMW